MKKAAFESETFEILYQYGLDVNEVYDRMRHQLDLFELSVRKGKEFVPCFRR